MKVHTPPPVAPEKLAEIAALLASGCDREKVIVRMRVLGFNKVEAIKMLRDSTGMALGEAKDIVHLSPAWADRFHSDDRLHDVVEQAAEMLP